MLPEDERKHEQRRRHSAGSAQLPNESGNIKALLSIGNKLLIVGERSTYHVLTPEQIDPEITAKNVPWVMAEEFSYGSSSPVIARTLLQFKEFDSHIQLENTNKSKLVMQLEKTVLYLTDCQVILDTYSNELDSVRQEVMNGLKRGGSAVHLPKVKNFEYLARTFFYAAKLAFIHAMKMYSIIPDWGAKAQGTVKRIVFVLENDSTFPNEFAESLRQFEDTIWRVGEIRNAIESLLQKELCDFSDL